MVEEEVQTSKAEFMTQKPVMVKAHTGILLATVIDGVTRKLLVLDRMAERYRPLLGPLQLTEKGQQELYSSDLPVEQTDSLRLLLPNVVMSYVLENIVNHGNNLALNFPQSFIQFILSQGLMSVKDLKSLGRNFGGFGLAKTSLTESDPNPTVSFAHLIVPSLPSGKLNVLKQSMGRSPWYIFASDYEIGCRWSDKKGKIDESADLLTNPTSRLKII